MLTPFTLPVVVPSLKLCPHCKGQMTVATWSMYMAQPVGQIDTRTYRFMAGVCLNCDGPDPDGDLNLPPDNYIASD